MPRLPAVAVPSVASTERLVTRSPKDKSSVMLRTSIPKVSRRSIIIASWTLISRSGPNDERPLLAESGPRGKTEPNKASYFGFRRGLHDGDLRLRNAADFRSAFL